MKDITKHINLDVSKKKLLPLLNLSPIFSSGLVPRFHPILYSIIALNRKVWHIRYWSDSIYPALTGCKTPTSRIRGKKTRIVSGVSTASKIPICSTNNQWGMKENSH